MYKTVIKLITFRYKNFAIVISSTIKLTNIHLTDPSSQRVQIVAVRDVVEAQQVHRQQHPPLPAPKVQPPRRRRRDLHEQQAVTSQLTLWEGFEVF